MSARSEAILRDTIEETFFFFGNKFDVERVLRQGWTKYLQALAEEREVEVPSVHRCRLCGQWYADLDDHADRHHPDEKEPLLDKGGERR